MVLHHRHESGEECNCSLELIWDEELNATVITEAGEPLRIGPAASLSPSHLLALAASSCLMTTLLTLAREAEVAVQGYVSSARLRAASGRAPDIELAPCVVVHTDADRIRIDELWPRAIEQSPALRLLGEHLRVEPTVRVVAST
jgi:organic hydroperoxide reductase OsmC/OhrA